jgi:hypothetical protein
MQSLILHKQQLLRKCTILCGLQVLITLAYCVPIALMLAGVSGFTYWFNRPENPIQKTWDAQKINTMKTAIAGAMVGASSCQLVQCFVRRPIC